MRVQAKQYDFDQGNPITAYVADMSYFSGKFEAFLRYKEIPFQRKTADVKTLVNDIYANTRMMKVPVVRLNDGNWLKDTTPMLAWFDQQKPEYSIYPKDPVTRFIALLIEDYADEWCWRSALYWRWYFEESRQLVAHRIGHEVLGDWPVPKRLSGWYFGRRQINTYLKGDGLTKQTEPFVKKHYTDMLKSMQSILSDSPYLLGDKPSIADFGLFGPMFRHFGLDPSPAKVMIEQAPAVYAWLARLWNEKGSNIECSAEFNDFSHPGWQYFLKDIITVYLPFLRANTQAWKEGSKRFDLPTPDVVYPKLKTVHYRVYCLEKLQGHFSELSESNKQAVERIFAEHGHFDLGDKVESGLIREFELPIEASKTKPSTMEKWLLTATGTPWDLPKWIKSRERPR